MFRSSEKTSPLDAVVVKATDENLTAENWELILNVCDSVNEDPEDGAKNAVISISKRLQVYNANVQLYSLTVVSSLAQNCGSKMQRELASKTFTQLLLKLAEDRNVHITVKTRIAEVMESLSDEFKADPSLRLMSDAYKKLKKHHPSIQPPGKPEKNKLTEADKKREQEELQIALALSLSESQDPYQSTVQVSGSEAYAVGDTFGGGQGPTQLSNQQQHQIQQQPQPAQTGNTAATVSRVRALYDLVATEEGELSFRKGDIIQVIESVFRDWWRGSLRGQIGIFPLNYVEPLPEPTKEELLKEAQDELRVFEQSRNIEKLLVVLNSADANSLVLAEDEAVQNLYHSTLSVRPKLVKLIDKYSQKKDELIELNDKFLKARRKYDHLMEDSMSQYTQRHSASGPSSQAQRRAVSGSTPYSPGQVPFSQHQSPPYPASPVVDYRRQSLPPASGQSPYPSGPPASNYPLQPPTHSSQSPYPQQNASQPPYSQQNASQTPYPSQHASQPPQSPYPQQQQPSEPLYQSSLPPPQRHAQPVAQQYTGQAQPVAQPVAQQYTDPARPGSQQYDPSAPSTSSPTESFGSGKGPYFNGYPTQRADSESSQPSGPPPTTFNQLPTSVTSVYAAPAEAIARQQEQAPYHGDHYQNQQNTGGPSALPVSSPSQYGYYPSAPSAPVAPQH